MSHHAHTAPPRRHLNNTHFAHRPTGPVILRYGQLLNPSIVSPNEVYHTSCATSVFARVLQRRVFLTNSDATLRTLRRLPCSSKRSNDSPNFIRYQEQLPLILDTFCFLDYNVSPVPPDPLAQFKLVTSHAKEKLPRPPLQIMIQALRHDINALSELLRRHICTALTPQNVLRQSAASLKQHFRLVRAIQNLYAEHSIMLAPHDNAFFFRSCSICSLYDPEIIRFCRDLHCILLRIFHGERIKPPSCRYFNPFPEMSDADLSRHSL